MSEQRVDVRAVQVSLMCDVCEFDGEAVAMLREPGVLISHPPKFQYRCALCGGVKTSKQQYPFIEWIPT